MAYYNHTCKMAQHCNAVWTTRMVLRSWGIAKTSGRAEASRSGCRYVVVESRQLQR